LLPGRLLVTGNAALELWDHGRRTSIACIRGTPQYYAHPAFSPDGRTIAYVLSTAPTSLAQDWGDDIYTSNADGSGARLVLRHEAPGAQVDSIAWIPDGGALVYGSFRIAYGSAGRSASAVYQVNRLNLTNGAIAPLLHDAAQAAISLDGKRLIFVSYPSGDFNVSVLGVAGLDGSDPHTILNGQNGFQGFFAPHLSPDGRRVVFAAIGGPLPGARTPDRKPAWRLATIVQSACSLIAHQLAPPARADGSPYEVWIANLDGTDIHPVANLREDVPYPLWSADGKQILFLGAAALYLASADGSGVKQIDKGVAHGQMDWYQR
jgi:Tol biopolymer transport system component